MSSKSFPKFSSLEFTKYSQEQMAGHVIQHWGAGKIKVHPQPQYIANSEYVKIVPRLPIEGSTSTPFS